MDIKTREDIKSVIDEFYSRVKKDELIGHIFNDIAKVNWDVHLPVMYDFWDTTILGAMSYTGNAMLPHFKLHKIFQLQKQHFDRWLIIFSETIDSLYEGDTAEEMKLRARNIAGLMEHKLNKPGIL